MKKLLLILMAVTTAVCLCSLAVADGTVVLTTKVPESTYTLNIPDNLAVDYGETEVELGTVTVTDAANFAEKKNINVTVTATPFASADTSTTIPYDLKSRDVRLDVSETLNADGKVIYFLGKKDGTVNLYGQTPYTGGVDPVTSEVSELFLKFEPNAWNKALAGDYTATLKFTSEIVVED